MRKTSIRELHINTSGLVREAAEGSVIVIERRGETVAELRPLSAPPRVAADKKARIFTSMRRMWARMPQSDDSTNEPESSRVRELVRKADVVYSSLWALAEFHAVLHRRRREGASSDRNMRELAARFSDHIEEGLWKLVPVNEALLRRTSSLMLAAPHDLFICTGDAVHLTPAHKTGERDVWTSDRHMLAAASYFGLTGRSVQLRGSITYRS